MAANWTDFVSGAVLTAAQLNGVLDDFQDIAIFNETQAASTAGGTFTTGSWQTRVLNTTIINNIASCAYYMRAIAPAFQANEHQIKIYNNTDAADVVLGGQGYSASTVETTTFSEAIAVVTITGTKSFLVQHRCAATKASNGLGTAITWGNNVFTRLEIRRIQ